MAVLLESEYNSDLRRYRLVVAIGHAEFLRASFLGERIVPLPWCVFRGILSLS